MEEFLRGAIALGSGVAGLFFFRFWKESHDRLFYMFGVAFFALGLSRTVLAVMGGHGEGSGYVYLVRLLVFLLILAAIVDKNMRG